MPSPCAIGVPIYGQARVTLEQLRSGIKDLSDGSDIASEISEGNSETPSGDVCLPHAEKECNGPQSTNEYHGNTESDFQDGRESYATPEASSGTTASDSSSNKTFYKRSRLDDTSDDTHADVDSCAKRTKLSCKRFICCYHNGPGRKCSGTDGAISDVIRKLSEQHDTHICDRCWTLKTRDESSGLPTHPREELHCRDYCLSPQCLKTSPLIGNRHLFNLETCKTKTSRVKPGDREAVFRFIFQLVHPSLDVPTEVMTDEHALHLDARPRQGRRKLTREELSMRADDLEKRLEQGDRQNSALNARVHQLEQALTASCNATSQEYERNLELEKQMRRIVAILGDALRTGVFEDHFGHKSLLARVVEDAPNALEFQTNLPLVQPGSESTGSQHSGSTRARPVTNVEGNAPSGVMFFDPTLDQNPFPTTTGYGGPSIAAADSFAPDFGLLDQGSRESEFILTASSSTGGNTCVRQKLP